MIATVLKLITSRLAGPIAAGLAVVLALGLGVQTVRLHGTQKQIAAAEVVQKATDRKLWAAEGNVSALQSGIDQQNDQILAWKADSDARLAKAEQAVTSAQTATLAAEIASARIKAHQPVGSDVCVRLLDADETFTENLK
jgi:uncharacterized protein HemX